MNENEIKSRVSSLLSRLSPDRKLYALSLLAHNITVGARAVYSERRGDDETIDKLYTLNEVQHRLSSQLMHIAARDGHVQPDDALIDYLYDFARRSGCEGELAFAIENTLSAITE
jgi:hypothetical protein